MPYKVILVEDDASYQKIISDLVEEDDRLELLSIEDNSLAAARSITRNQPDIVLLDVEISGLNGLEVLDTLYNKPVALVISANPDYKADAAELNVAGYMVKPIKSKADFTGQIDKCIALVEKRRT